MMPLDADAHPAGRWPSSGAAQLAAGRLTALPNSRFTSSWKRSTPSLNSVAPVLRFRITASARLAGFTVHLVLAGSTISAAMAPLLECWMRSDEVRLMAPNSAGVARRCPFGSGYTVPAYHWYQRHPPGATVVLRFAPTCEPSEYCTSIDTSC